MRGSTTLPGYDSVRIPGQERGNILTERTKNGIPLHPNLVKALADIAEELKIPILESRSDPKSE
jgi:LDH2 family malate/lactate/ureidoglycolate dehydrogenase